MTVDDAAITVAYARNIADGYGLVLSPRGERIEGVTSLLWTIAIAPSRVFGLGFAAFAKLLGIALAAVAIAGIAFFPAALRKRAPRYFDLVAPLLVALMPNYALWAGSGLEHGLFAALAAWSLHAVAIEERDPERFPWSAALLWLLFLTRPDGALYAVAVGAAKLFRSVPPKRPRRQDVLWAIALAVSIGAVELFRLAYFAWPLPNPIYARLRWSGLGDAVFFSPSRGWSHLRAWLDAYRLLSVAPLALAAIFGPKPHGARFALVSSTAVALLAPVAAQDDPQSEFRSLTNGSLFLALCLCEGARSAFALASRLTPRSARPALRLLATPIIAVAILRYGARFYTTRWTAAMQRSPVGAGSYPAPAREFERARRQLAIDGRPSLLTATIAEAALESDLTVVDMLGNAHVGAAHSSPADPAGFREALLGEDPPTFARIDPAISGAFELSRLEELSQLYFALPASHANSAHRLYVRRADVAAPWALTAARVASSSGATPDGVTLSHERPEPRSTVLVDVAFARVDPSMASAIVLQDDHGAEALRVEAPVFGGLLEPGAALPGERPRARARLVIPRAGRFRVLWIGAGGATVAIAELDAQLGANASESRALDQKMTEHLQSDRYDRAYTLARTLSLRVVAAPADAVARSAVVRLARALADRARSAADARAYSISASIAREARSLAPWDLQTGAVCGAVAERLADAAADAEGRGELARAFEHARDAVLVDPRRSWSRRRAERLRNRRSHSYDAGRSLAAYRAAAAAVASHDPAEVDRTLVFMASAAQWIEAARLSERLGHTPRDPAARRAVARGYLSQGRAREALALVSGVPCREARDPEVTRALRAIMGAAAYRPNDDACDTVVTAPEASFDDLRGSFESERFSQWTAVGAAFGSGPVSSPRCETAWINGWRGQRYASSLARCDARARGTLRSRVFEVRSEGLSLLVGGGADVGRTGVRVALEDDTTVAQIAGPGHDGMTRRFVDLRALIGRRVFIEAYDRATDGALAHVMIDDVREEPVVPVGVTAVLVAAPR